MTQSVTIRFPNRLKQQKICASVKILILMNTLDFIRYLENNESENVKDINEKSTSWTADGLMAMI